MSKSTSGTRRWAGSVPIAPLHSAWIWPPAAASSGPRGLLGRSSPTPAGARAPRAARARRPRLRRRVQRGVHATGRGTSRSGTGCGSGARGDGGSGTSPARRPRFLDVAEHAEQEAEDRRWCRRISARTPPGRRPASGRRARGRGPPRRPRRPGPRGRVPSRSVVTDATSHCDTDPGARVRCPSPREVMRRLFFGRGAVRSYSTRSR